MVKMIYLNLVYLQSIFRYNTAVKNTRIVGSKTAELIVWLVRERLTSYDHIHVLGSSLGAQAAGYVGHFTGGWLIIKQNGKYISIFQDGNLSRITGLDPSGPLFYSVAASERCELRNCTDTSKGSTAFYKVAQPLN